MGRRARMPRLRPAYRRRSGRGGFARLAGCRQSRWPRCRGAICRFLSGRRSRSFTRRIVGCVRSLAGWVARRRRFRGSCAVTRRLAVTPWRTGRRPRSGTRSGVPAVRRSRSSPSTTCCGSRCGTGSPASSPGRTAGSCRARMRVGLAAAMAADRTGGGRERGARSRSRTGSGSTSPMIRALALLVDQAVHHAQRGSVSRTKKVTARFKISRSLSSSRTYRRRRRSSSRSLVVSPSARSP